MRTISLSLLVLLFGTHAFAQTAASSDGLTTEAAINESASEDLATSLTRKRPLFLGIVDGLGNPGDLSSGGVTTTVGLMWNLQNGDKVGFGQDIESSVNVHLTTADHKTLADRGNDTKMGWTALRYQLGKHSIWGSDDIFALARYYAPVEATNQRWLQDPFTKHELVGNQGILRGDLEIPWMLTPNWIVSYYANPRIMPVTQNDANYDFGRSMARFNHYGYAYYVANDSLKFYGYYGYEHRFGMNEGMHMYNMKAIPGAGFIKDLSKTTFLQAEMTHSMQLVNDNLAGISSGINNYDLRSENIGYEVTLFTLM